ncbi:hypothetical protein L1987_45445 [Smallanthus sonchifolius]|uniref:Uncharacterized protein n=1 Tax=Smallanthus sonchifolius TaxID=185202 RepID=A0ACB9FY10_9ASTR|nr:hypothetical protein L1987_45445 [Smallanthus sonchifolius]
MTRWWWWWWMVVLAVVFMVFLSNPGRSQPQTNILIQTCSPVNATNIQNFFSILNDTFRDIRRQLSNNNTYFATSELSRNSQPVYIMAQCRKYMSTSDCVSCFDFAASSIRSCAAFNGARSVLDGCFLRYESDSFYNQTTILPGNPGLCGNRTSSQQSIFETVVDGLLSSLSIATPKINGFYAAATSPIVGTNTSVAYAIAQCVETVTPDGCKSCLQVAYADIRSCASDVTDGRAIDTACFMRYSWPAFFRNNQTTDITPFLRDGETSGIPMLVFFSSYDLYMDTSSSSFDNSVACTGQLNCKAQRISATAISRKRQTISGKKISSEKEGLEMCTRYSPYLVIFKMSNTEQMKTDNIQNSYAILDDEEVVAVKKLKVGNERAKVGFENEILLISNIHHRNLLRLLGWSSEGSNLLLVLEYMPNGSLDRFLWGATPHRNMFYMAFYQIRLTLSALAWKLYESKNLVKLVDETMDVKQDEEKHMMKIIEIGLLCTQSPVSERPTMSEVVFMLQNDPSLGERHLTRPNFTDPSRRIHIR